MTSFLLLRHRHRRRRPEEPRSSRVHGMVVHRVCRCLFIFAMTGIVACGRDARPVGPDLTVPASIVVAPDSVRVSVDDTARIRAVVLNVAGDTLTDAPILFASQDTTIATIDSAGLVRGRAGGVSDLIVASGSVTATVRVHVRVNGTLVMSPDVGFIQGTDTLQLTVVVRDSADAVVANPIVRYHSLDTTVVRVSAAGGVTFGAVAGTVTITASS